LEGGREAKGAVSSGQFNKGIRRELEKEEEEEREEEVKEVSIPSDSFSLASLA